MMWARGIDESQPALLGFLARPYLLIYGMFLAVMVSLSFAQPTIHEVGMLLRWPVLGLAAAVGLGGAFAGGFKRPSAAQIWLTVFVGCAAASSIYSIDKWYTFQRSGSVALLLCATAIGLFAYCRSTSNARALTDMLWCLGTILVLGGFVFRLGAEEGSARYEGLHSRATGAGTFAVLFLPIVVYQARYRFGGAMKVVAWLIIGLFLGQLVLSGARMALVTGLLICLALWFEYYGIKAIAGLVALAVLAPAPFVLDSTLTDRLVEKSDRLVRAESFGTFTGRLDRWMFGLEQFVKKPAIGHGFGASRTLAGFEDPARFKLLPGEVFNLHSDQIEVLMDLGIIGYIPFALFWICLGVVSLRLLAAPRSPVRQLALAYLGSVAYAFGDTFMHGGFLAAGGGVSAFSWSMIAVALGLERLGRTARTPIANLVENAGPNDHQITARQTARSKATVASGAAMQDESSPRAIPGDEEFRQSRRRCLERQQLRSKLPSVRSMLAGHR